MEHQPASKHYQLKWHSFGAHLHSSVASSYDSDAFTDVTLFTVDGRHLNAHRFILAACSQYLHQVLRSQQAAGGQLHQHRYHQLPVVIVMPPEITYRTLKTLVQYMYCGETTVSNDILENVLRGGDILKVQGLWRPDHSPGATHHQHHQQPQQPQNHKQSAAKSPVKLVQKVASSSASASASSPSSSSVRSGADGKMEDGKRSENASPDKSPPRQHLQQQQPSANQQPMPPVRPSSAGKENRTTPPDKERRLPDDDYLMIKDEPIEWSEEYEMSEGEMYSTEISIKPEVVFSNDEKSYSEDGDEVYSPLTCELCSEVFTLPAEWVRHIQTHTDTQPAKRTRRGRGESEDDGVYPALQCDLCQKRFQTPAEWVRHIQSTHTEYELAVSNNSARPRSVRTTGSAHKTCCICKKPFPSHASMLIHKRTHTGERPFVCEYCQKGFNVKSNLLRHLRTLHDKIVSSTDVPDGNT